MMPRKVLQFVVVQHAQYLIAWGLWRCQPDAARLAHPTCLGIVLVLGTSMRCAVRHEKVASNMCCAHPTRWMITCSMLISSHLKARITQHVLPPKLSECREEQHEVALALYTGSCSGPQHGRREELRCYEASSISQNVKYTGLCVL